VQQQQQLLQQLDPDVEEAPTALEGRTLIASDRRGASPLAS